MSFAIDAIAARLEAGEPLNDREAAELAGTADLLTLGMLGEQERRRRHGQRATFVRVADIALDGSDGPEPVPAGEWRIVGQFERLADATAFIRRVAGRAGDIPVSGFSLAALETFSATNGTPLLDLLAGLRDAGLQLIAEAPIDRLVSPERAVESVIAAGLGLARVTVHQREPSEGLTGISRAVRLQDSVGIVRSFAPLPRLEPPQSTGYDDVRQVALARLLAHNIQSIQVDWALYGPKLAQVALSFGADDLDAVSPAGPDARGARRAPLEEVRHNIRAASLDPIERNGHFEPVTP